MGSQRKGTKDSGSRITGQSESPFRDPGPIVNDREEGNRSRRSGNLAGRIQKRSHARSPQPTCIPPLARLSRGLDQCSPLPKPTPMLSQPGTMALLTCVDLRCQSLQASPMVAPAPEWTERRLHGVAAPRAGRMALK